LFLLTPPPHIYTLSLHDALPISSNTQLRSHVAWKLLYVRARELSKEVLIVSSDAQIRSVAHGVKFRVATSLEASSPAKPRPASRDRKSTRLNSSHLGISYAVFCL